MINKQQEDLQKLYRSADQLKAKYKSKKEQFTALQQELQETVPMEEFNRVTDLNTALHKAKKEVDQKLQYMQEKL